MKRPFSETHIARNIRAQHLSTVAEENVPDEGSDRAPSPQPSNNDSNIDDGDKDETSTSSATSATLNVSAPSVAGQSTAANLKPSYPDVEAITAETLNSHMFTADNPPLDLLVRTSGVERLSDFMLWQCHENTDIVFMECLWPEVNLRHFLPVLLEWQWRKRKQAETERGRSRSKDE
jgi:ditrans,polycis-polyprenyl diphosphate synthase